MQLQGEQIKRESKQGKIGENSQRGRNKEYQRWRERELGFERQSKDLWEVERGIQKERMIERKECNSENDYQRWRERIKKGYRKKDRDIFIERREKG